MKVFNILSLGAGIQSSTLLLMSCRGVLPKLDAAIFADTQCEPEYVYTQLGQISAIAATAGIPVLQVTAGDLYAGINRKGEDARFASIPAFTLRGGKLRRQCTKEYKIEPIYKAIREKIIGLVPRKNWPKNVVVHQWMGISSDESSRVKPSRLNGVINHYPLINYPTDYFDKNYSRTDCEEWLKKHFSHLNIRRSACVVCPYRSNPEWREMKDRNPQEFNKAVSFDRSIRQMSRIEEPVFLHRSLRPLDKADLRTESEKGQTNLWNEECEGHCGV